MADIEKAPAKPVDKPVEVPMLPCDCGKAEMKPIKDLTEIVITKAGSDALVLRYCTGDLKCMAAVNAKCK